MADKVIFINQAPKIFRRPLFYLLLFSRSNFLLNQNQPTFTKINLNPLLQKIKEKPQPHPHPLLYKLLFKPSLHLKCRSSHLNIVSNIQAVFFRHPVSSENEEDWTIWSEEEDEAWVRGCGMQLPNSNPWHGELSCHGSTPPGMPYYGTFLLSASKV